LIERYDETWRLVADTYLWARLLAAAFDTFSAFDFTSHVR
jgi:hypothetical protein